MSSTVASAAGLQRARAAGIPAHFIDHAARTRETHDREMLAVLRVHDISLVCLAGYMRLLSPAFIGAFPGRILNVHPSLLPAFPGLDAARQAWEHGVQYRRTVHSSTRGSDSARVVLQKRSRVKVHTRDPAARI